MQPPFTQWLNEQLQADEDKEVSRGDLLFRTGQPVTRLYLLASGEIHLVRPLSHGSILTIHRTLPGCLVAEASLYAANYHCDALALRDSQLFGYDRQRVLQQLRSHPDFAERLSAHLAGEVLALRTKLELAHIQSADERLLTWIQLQLAPQSATLIIDRPLKSIASELGLAHETLYRSLKHLEDRQRIRRESGKIIILPEK